MFYTDDRIELDVQCSLSQSPVDANAGWFLVFGCFAAAGGRWMKFLIRKTQSY
jgi:hypothetical protein